MNLAKVIVTYGFFIGLAASLPIAAQQAEAPVRVGSPGVARLRLEAYIPPIYPQIAMSARVSGEVVLEATIGADGRPRDFRVTRSIPLLDQAAIEAARQWRFESPTLRGVTAPVTSPISISFLPTGAFALPLLDVQSSSLPRDFAIVFASNCPDGSGFDFNTVTGVFERRDGRVATRVDLRVKAFPLESIYDVITKTGFTSDPARLVQWTVLPQPQISDSGIRATVAPDGPVFLTPSHGAEPRQYYLDVRMNGTWTRLFPPASWSKPYRPNDVAARDRELERGALQIARLLQNHVESIEVMRRLRRNQQWCRWHGLTQ